MEPQSGIRTWQWVVTVIVIIVLIILGINLFGGKGTTTPATETPTPTETTAATTGNRITMVDQFPGNVVFLSSVQTSDPAWVVIHADNAGQPGKVIGSAHVGAGVNPVKVTLTQPTVEGGTYYAVLYTDNGGTKFDAAKDQPMKDAAGNIILHVFKASASVGAGLKG